MSGPYTGAAAAISEIAMATKQVIKRVLFPGVDIHARSRYRHLPRFFESGDIQTLDAGCGNGMLSYAAYRLGNRVLGLSFDAGEVERNRRFYTAIGADEARLWFEHRNLYDVSSLGKSRFDQIICSETLEHLRDDAAILRGMAGVLRRGGVLHLCCPSAVHPENALGRSDEPEDGRHVRDGYTLDSYMDLLAPLGFEIEHSVGIGSAPVVRADKAIRTARERLGHGAAIPLLMPALALRFFDPLDPPVPFSIYVKARLHSRL